MEAVDSAEILVVTINLNLQCHTSEDHSLLTIQSNPHTNLSLSPVLKINFQIYSDLPSCLAA
jgi:hypothetical protein